LFYRGGLRIAPFAMPLSKPSTLARLSARENITKLEWSVCSDRTMSRIVELGDAVGR
jgi:hypothetical protein